MYKVVNLWSGPVQVDAIVPKADGGTSLTIRGLRPQEAVYLEKPGPSTMTLKDKGRVSCEPDDEGYQKLQGALQKEQELRQIRLMKTKVAQGKMAPEALPLRQRSGAYLKKRKAPEHEAPDDNK